MDTSREKITRVGVHGLRASLMGHAGGAVTNRAFSYDGSNRLRRIERDGVITELTYDVDDALVYEERGADVYERFQGYRRGPNGTIHSPLGMVRVLDAGDFSVQEVRIAMLDIDGQALFTWDLYGNEKSREITGLYGLPLVGPVWDDGEVWEVDGLPDPLPLGHPPSLGKSVGMGRRLHIPESDRIAKTGVEAAPLGLV